MVISQTEKNMKKQYIKPDVVVLELKSSGIICTSLYESLDSNVADDGLVFPQSDEGFDIDIRGTQGRILIGNGYLNVFKSAPSTLYTGFKSLSPDSAVKMPQQTLYFSNMVQNAVDFLDGKASLKSTLQNGIDALSILEEIKNMIS